MGREPPHLYSAFLNLQGRDVLLVGGGGVAFRKARGLDQAGCRITVVARRFLPSFKDWLTEQKIRWDERAYRKGEAGDYFLVVSATDDPEVNEAVAGDAARTGRLVNVVDKPELCNFYVPSVVRRRALQIAISTDGKCPALARKMRMDLEGIVCEQYGPLLETLASIRENLKAGIPSPPLRKAILERILSSKAVQRFLSGEPRLLEKMMKGWERARKCTDRSGPKDPSSRSPG
jgi:precorrin-2 dehydrogenase/sirohydrochlorin ferrochelatase